MLKNIETWVEKEANKANAEIQESAVVAIHRWIEKQFDNNVHISDIEKGLDSMDSLELRICGYKHIVRLLGRRLFVYCIQETK